MMCNDWLNQAIFCLCNSNAPKCDAEIILEKVMGRSRADFLMFDTKILNNTQLNQANILLIRRIRGEPIAYLVGMCSFWTLNLNICSDVFIPRADTECLVEQVLLNFPLFPSLKVLDLGTGSGAVALAIASERPNWKIRGVDIVPKVIDVASKNSILLRMKNVKFSLGYWFHGLKKNNYDLIISNPPYLGINDPHLLRGDLRFEPKIALVSKNEGLADLSYICRNSYKYLKLGGWLILEHGWLQGKKIRQLFIQSGFKCVTTIRDYNNKERITFGKYF